MRFAAIVFDFDGVIADSETLANDTLANSLTAAGMPTTREQSFALYMGYSWADNQRLIEADFGRALPAGFVERRRAMLLERQHEITAIPGLPAFLDRIDGVPRAIASSSSRQWIERILAHIGLSAHFPHIFSVAAGDAPRGKPAPDIYLRAFAELGVDPAHGLVVEDTPVGVRAGVAAGAQVAGLLAGSHVRPGHADLLRAAGAHAICEGYDDVAALAGLTASTGTRARSSPPAPATTG